ncbi:MAG TPA: molybdenum cofactor guanylyltransferase [Terriglobia bacterium]|nr:molybdenum cofactor guanylyltransferase [Terriglobia bacterium]
MKERFSELTGFVLAGGASTRMGRPKQDLQLERETLLARMVRRAQAVAGTVVVLGPLECACGLGVRTLPDELRRRGPLGAIYTGLRHTRTEFNLFLSCDLPFIEARFLRFLAGRALASRADATLVETPDGNLQPLAGIYRRRALGAVRRSLENGRNKVTSFFCAVRVHRVQWPEAARAGFRASIFDNLNTPDDFARARARIEGG